MAGVALMKKRCRGDATLNNPDAVLEAASALAGLSGSPPAPSASPASSDDNKSHRASSPPSSPREGGAGGAGSQSKSDKNKASNANVSFPEKLMEILSTLESESSDGSTMSDQPIAWLPSGDGFVIRRPNEFTLQVLPRFFSQRTEFSSFTRKLYWWGFRKVSRGSGCDAFQHQFFRRAEPSLCRKMKGRSRKKSKKASGASSNKSKSKEAIAGVKAKQQFKVEASSEMVTEEANKAGKTSPMLVAAPTMPAMSSPNPALPIHKALAFGTGSANNLTADPNQAANLLLNSSPLIAAAGLRIQQAAAAALQQQQQQQQQQATSTAAQNQSATQAAVQQLVMQHAAATNQAVALAAAAARQQQVQQVQVQQQVTQQNQHQLNNVAAHLAALQRLTTAGTGGQAISPPAPAAPAAVTNATSVPQGAQVVIHVHHHKTADGKEYVTLSQSNSPYGAQA